MAEISYVKLDISKFIMEYARLGGPLASSTTKAEWLDDFASTLASKNQDGQPYAASLLAEVDEFKARDRERKETKKREEEAKKRKAAMVMPG